MHLMFHNTIYDLCEQQVHHGNNQDDHQDNEAVYPEFPGQEQFRNQDQRIDVIKGSQQEKEKRIPGNKIIADVLPVVVNKRQQEKPKPEQNMDCYGKRSGLYALVHLH